MAQQGHFGFQAHKCQIDAADQPKIEKQHRNEIVTNRLRRSGHVGYFFFLAKAGKTRAQAKCAKGSDREFLMRARLPL